MTKFAVFFMTLVMSTYSYASGFDIQRLGGWGYWYADVALDKREPKVCFLTTELDNGAVFLIGFNKQPERSFKISLVKDSWSIPDVEGIKVSFHFDRRNPYILYGYTGHEGTGIVIDIYENGVNIPTFMSLFMESAILRVKFEGSEGDWVLGMKGSKATTLKFIECADTLKDAPTVPTQPFNSQRDSESMGSRPYMFNPNTDDQKAFDPKPNNPSRLTPEEADKIEQDRKKGLLPGQVREQPSTIRYF